MIPRYAGIGLICPAFTVDVLPGGQLSAGELYFSFQLQNRAGFNLPSVSNKITITTNSKIRIKIPVSVAKPGWDIHYFLISCGPSADASGHIQIARIPGFQFGLGIEPQSVRSPLPQTIELSKPDHVALAPSVGTLNDLPTGTNRLDGQVRWVTNEAKWLEYRADSKLPTSVDVIAADIGQWVRIGSASTYVSDTETGVGCDRAITEINPLTTIPTPPYPGESGSKHLPSWEAQYWLFNDDEYVLPAGTEFGIELEYNNKRSPDLLSGLFMVKFSGFVGLDGSIRTADTEGRNFPNLGAFFPWTPKLTTPFVTADDLQPGEAIALAVKPFFSVAELNNQLTPKSVIGVLPAIRTQSGDYNPLGKLLPNGAVFAIGDKYRVVPGSGLSVDILSGTALVGGYDFPQKPRRNIPGIQPNLAGQKIIINGNGGVLLAEPTYTPTDAEAIRAIVSTVAGESATSEWSEEIAITSGGIRLTLNYPSAIRANYPDVIAGNNKGAFNAQIVKIYVQKRDTGEIRSFSGFGVVVGSSQIIEIENWTSGAVATLPTPAADFSLHAPGVVTIQSGDGSFPAGNYRASYSFVYDGGQITSISHSSPPCITEWDGDFQPASLQVGTVSLLQPGSQPTITNSGTGNNAVLNFGIPKGDRGEKGDTGETGQKGDTGDRGEGFRFRGNFSSEYSYERNDVVSSNGRAWIYDAYAPSEQGADPPGQDNRWIIFAEKGQEGQQGVRGRSITWRGAWNDELPYNEGDLVQTSDKKIWVCKTLIQSAELYQYPGSWPPSYYSDEDAQATKLIKFSETAYNLPINYFIDKANTYYGDSEVNLRLRNGDPFETNNSQTITTIEARLYNYVTITPTLNTNYLVIDSGSDNVFFKPKGATLVMVNAE
jgi:hypothetical protein